MSQSVREHLHPFRRNESCGFSFYFYMWPVCAGVKYVRGGEVFEVKDEEGVSLNNPNKYDPFSCFSSALLTSI